MATRDVSDSYPRCPVLPPGPNPRRAEGLRERLVATIPFLLHVAVTPLTGWYQGAKHALEAEWSMDLDQALEHESKAQARLMEHPNFREAYEAFRAKREPKFQG